MGDAQQCNGKRGEELERGQGVSVVSGRANASPPWSAAHDRAR
jgi:hypothetical protein